jgi:transcriptional regulator EpsA
MEQPVILSQREQEYLFSAIEAALPVREMQSLFLWTQGQLQAMLPHKYILFIQFGPDDELLRIECLHGCVPDAATLRRLADPEHGLGVRLARHCRATGAMPASMDTSDAEEAHPLASFRPALAECGLGNALVHGTDRLSGGASFFALFGMPGRPGGREAYFLQLLLPYLHVTLSGLRDRRLSARGGSNSAAGPLARDLSRRELEVLRWVREGKNNEEVAQLLGISALTVKNHLQRLYRVLGVGNRTHAISRCMALRLLERQAQPRDGV